MHYKAKHVPHDGFVADADLLMREFNRAQDAASELDQNNFDDVGVLFQHAKSPAASTDGLTFTHDSSLLLTNPNAGTAESMTSIGTGTAATVRGEWLPIYDGGGTSNPVSLSFTLPTAMWVILIAQVEYEVASGTSATYYGIRGRMLVDGEPANTSTTSPAVQLAGGSAYWSVYMEEFVFLEPGPHRIEIQGADLRQGDSEIAASHRRTILAMGLTR